MAAPVCRYIFFFILLLPCTGAFPQGRWERINSPTGHSLNSICFTDSLNGWVAGDSGIILHTSDAGRHWARQESHTLNDIICIFFLNSRLGWASAFQYSTSPFGTILMTTTDGGANWSASQFPVNDVFFTCILFRDSLNGWMGARPHGIFRTTDGGGSWHRTIIDTSTLAFFPVLKIRFWDERYGYACGGIFDVAGVIWSTVDGGDHWKAIDPVYAPADEVHDLHLYDSINVIGAGGDPDFGYGVGMIRSHDGGLTWSYHELGYQGFALNIDFRTPREAWCGLGSQGNLICSEDAGETWTRIPSPDSVITSGMSFPDSLHGYACGRNGALLKFTPLNDGLSEPGDEGSARKIVIGPAVPNPFKASTRITVIIPAGADCSGMEPAVYSLTGEKTVMKGIVLHPGKNDIIFCAGDLPAGMYFFTVEGGGAGLKPLKLLLHR